MDIDRLISEFDAKHESYKQLEENAKRLLFEELSRKKIKIHLIHSRVKSFNSFHDKIRRKKYIDPFNEVKDIVGLRVVCLFLSNISKIHEIIRKIFEVLEEENKIENKPKDVFGYLDLQLIAKLKNQTSEQSLENVQNIPFEIQIRTITQDAWAAISHTLDYKQESQIPPELKRDFYALNGLFYVADTHFDMLDKKQGQKTLDENSKNSSLGGKQQ